MVAISISMHAPRRGPIPGRTFESPSFVKYSNLRCSARIALHAPSVACPYRAIAGHRNAQGNAPRSLMTGHLSHAERTRSMTSDYLRSSQPQDGNAGSGPATRCNGSGA